MLRQTRSISQAAYPRVNDLRAVQLSIAAHPKGQTLRQPTRSATARHRFCQSTSRRQLPVPAFTGASGAEPTPCCSQSIDGDWDEVLTCDFLVIGSGIAGLSYALKVANNGSVIMVSKETANEGSTAYAQGGISAVFGKDDSVESHIQDTMRAGGYLNTYGYVLRSEKGHLRNLSMHVRGGGDACKTVAIPFMPMYTWAFRSSNAQKLGSLLKAVEVHTGHVSCCDLVPLSQVQKKGCLTIIVIVKNRFRCTCMLHQAGRLHSNSH